MLTLSALLHHLSDEDRERVDKLDDEIYKLQGNCKSYKDTLRLARLYRRRNNIIKGLCK